MLIDNGYFSAILRDEFQEQRVDYLTFSQSICQGYLRLRTYVYDALPYQANPPTPEQSRLYASKTKFFETIKRLPSFEVRFGRQRPRPGGYIQKGVDVLLAIDLVRLSSKGQIQKAFLVAGDADFAPVVRAAKDEGVIVKLYHSEGLQEANGRMLKKYSDELWRECDEREPMTKSLIDGCLLH